MNPFGIDGYWKIDPDNRQDRSSGRCITRKLTPEEIEKLINNKPALPTKKPFVELVYKDMKNKKEDDESMKKIDEQRLLEICKENGFSEKAYVIASEEFGVTPHSVQCYVSKKGLSKKGSHQIEIKQVKTNSKPSIDVDKILEICRINGTGSEGAKAVAKEFGLTEKQAENQIYLKKIRRMLTAQKQLTVDNQKQQVKESESPAEKKVMETSNIPEVTSSEPSKEAPKAELSDDEMDILNKINRLIEENKNLRRDKARLKAALDGIENILKSIA